jgi:Lon-like ATP-dependent protease
MQVRWYCREAGVRQLAQKLERVARKHALDVVRYQEELQVGGSPATGGSHSSWPSLWPFEPPPPKKGKHGKPAAPRAGALRWVVDEESLAAFVGKPAFTKDRLYDGAPPPGVVMGLAWTSLGGTSLYVEVTSVPGAPDGSGGRSSSAARSRSGGRTGNGNRGGNSDGGDGDSSDAGGGRGSSGAGGLQVAGQAVM